MHTIISTALTPPPTLLYITWGLIWDLKTKKHRDPKMKKEDPDIYIYLEERVYISYKVIDEIK